ncbi:MAG: translocation/assembly module TamB domain-containing protein [Calditrichaeota bacterium]|nr:translocation/assembly module TamB domain-containing protein [Calditrichota bacterium]
MRERRWVLLVVAVLAVVGLVAYYGWRISGASQHIRNLVIESVRPALGEGLSVGHVEVGFGTLHLRDVQLDRRTFLLHADEVRLGFSLVRLLLGGLESAQMGGNALVVNPRLTIRRQSATSKAPLAPSAPQLQPSPPAAGQKPFALLRGLTISGGQIILADSTGQQLVVVRDAEGMAVADQGTRASFHLTGKLFSSRGRNLDLHGILDLTSLKLEQAEVALHAYDVSKVPPLAKGQIVPQKGNIEGSFAVRSAPNWPWGLALTGSLRLSEGSVLLRGTEVALDDLSVAIDSKGDTLELAAQGMAQKAELTLRGRLWDLLRPQLDLVLSGRGIELETLAPVVAPSAKVRLSGKATLEVALQGRLDSLRASGWASFPRLKVGAVAARQAQVGFSYADSVLRVRHLRLNCFGNSVEGAATVTFTQAGAQLQAQLRGRGDAAGELRRALAAAVASCPDSFAVEVGGSVAAPWVRGRFGLTLLDEHGAAVPMQGTLAYADRTTEVIAQGPGGLRLQAAVRGRQLSIEGQNLQGPASVLWKLPARAQLRRLECDVALRGRSDSLATLVEGRWRDANDLVHPLLSASGVLLGSKQRRSWRSSTKFFPVDREPVDGVLELNLRKGVVELSRLMLGESVTGGLKIEGGKIQGRLRLRGAPLEYFALLADTVVQGQLSGEISLGGSTRSPRIEGALQLASAYFHRQGPFAGEVAFQVQDSTASLRQLAIRHGSRQIVSAEGLLGPGRRIAQLRLTGADVDLATVVAAATGKTEVIRGQANLHLLVQGGPQGVTVNGDATLVEGQLLGVAFDTLRLVLAGRPEVVPDGASGRDYAWMPVLRLVRKGAFGIQGKGALPLNLTDPMSVEIAGQGDPLALVDEASGFVKEAKSRGTLHLRIGGTLAAPRLEQGELNIERGVLRFASVVPVVKELQGTLRLHPESRFVEVSELRGLMGGEPFVIYNVPAVGKEYRRALQPFELEDLGVSLGILVVETSPDGVVLSIPGLMEPGEYGRFQLLGYGSNDRFCIAGPAERPILYGTMVLHGVRFGYPFNGGGQGVSPEVTQLLEMVEWDLRVVPGTNTRYVKKLPGGLDNVYVTLDLDERYGGLRFTGQLRDETFRIEGELRSTRGTVEYLDMNFRLEQAGIEFDRNTLVPVVYGRAYTTVADSNGIPSQIYLTLATVDRALEGRRVDERVLDQRYRARWDELRFQLSSDNAALGSNEAQLLASLGYTPERLRQKTVDVIGISADNLVFRPLFRPFERRLERYLGLDVVRLSSRLTRNLIEMNLATTPMPSKLYLLRSSRLTVGKYLSDDLYLVYTGQLESGLDYRYQVPGLGLHHTLGLELRINPKLLIEMEYDYDGLLLWRKDDTRLWIRHWFPF